MGYGEISDAIILTIGPGLLCNIVQQYIEIICNNNSIPKKCIEIVMDTFLFLNIYFDIMKEHHISK